MASQGAAAAATARELELTAQARDEAERTVSQLQHVRLKPLYPIKAGSA